MAGYFTKLAGYVYEGSHEAKVALSSGKFVEIDAEGKVVLATKASDTVLRVKEKSSLMGKDALLLDVVSVGADEVFMVEQTFDGYNEANFDEAEDTVEANRLVRMKRPLAGEQILVAVETALFGSINVGDKVQPTTNGVLVKKA